MASTVDTFGPTASAFLISLTQKHPGQKGQKGQKVRPLTDGDFAGFMKLQG
jgi:hypothetical protein